ncbi:MAPEG family protein [Novosphingobium sp. BL-8H]|uniref:MAPEG family protein n=1 Tax=Novosphingobium sp. BL-8H TaxID=3127640 RepID=UPI0037581AA8
MTGMAILQPVVALAAWTMVMWFWLYGSRISSFGKVDPEELIDDPHVSLDHVLPPQVEWKAHNYRHLLQDPVVFYAITLTLAVLRLGDGLNTQVAWAYVVFRVLHSIVQTTFNQMVPRFALYALSSFCLIFLVARAALAMF